MADLVAADRRSFESQALSHLDALYRFALHLSGEPMQAEDLVQETMLKAIRAWDQFEPGTNLRAWLMTILRNQFINEYRKSRRTPRPVRLEDTRPLDISQVVGEADPEGSFFSQIVDEQVLRAIDALPPDYRTALVLSDVERMSYAEIADVLGIPLGTVKSRISRARRQVQVVLFDYAVEMGYVSARSAPGGAAL